MADIVMAYSTAHAPMMTADPDSAPQAMANNFFGALGIARDKAEALDPQALVMVSGEHFTNFFLDNMPQVCVGVGESHLGPVEKWLGIDRVEVPGDPGLGQAILAGTLERGHMPAYSHRLTVDHGFMTVYHDLRPAKDLPLVPMIMNCTNPPLMTLVALGGVPLGWPGAAEEAARCLDELGMHGIAIGSQGGGADLDAAVNEPLWALLSERSVFTFLHPSGSPAPQRTKDFWFPQLVGYPMETALSAARLVFSGLTDRHPFPLCLAHGGGCLPALRGRLTLGWERKPQARTIPDPPTVYLDRFYYDTAVFDPALLRRLVEDVGAGHLLTGTDYPFDLADRDPVATVGAVLDGADREQVLGRTAAQLLRIGHRSVGDRSVTGS